MARRARGVAARSARRRSGRSRGCRATRPTSWLDRIASVSFVARLEPAAREAAARAGARRGRRHCRSRSTSTTAPTCSSFREPVSAAHPKVRGSGSERGTVPMNVFQPVSAGSRGRAAQGAAVAAGGRPAVRSQPESAVSALGPRGPTGSPPVSQPTRHHSAISAATRSRSAGRRSRRRRARRRARPGTRPGPGLVPRGAARRPRARARARRSRRRGSRPSRSRPRRRARATTARSTSSASPPRSRIALDRLERAHRLELASTRVAERVRDRHRAARVEVDQHERLLRRRHQHVGCRPRRSGRRRTRR